MIVIRNADELRNKLKQCCGMAVGFVPTMGYLHSGHISLVEASKARADMTVVSIFVNPTQFGPNEDFECYPRDERRDLSLLEKAGADIVFLPGVEDIYPSGNATDIVLNSPITRRLCAKTRPTHFNGVTNVVSRLLCLIKPDYAFFGRKDAQQLAIITRMAKDMLIGTEIVGCPIVREADGLALSSRNTYLSEAERQNALSISRSLFAAERGINEGKSVAEIRAEITSEIEAAGGKVDYVEIVDPFLLESLESFDSGRTKCFSERVGSAESSGKSGSPEQSEEAGCEMADYMIAVAAYFGKTRLIDNRARIDGVCI